MSQIMQQLDQILRRLPRWAGCGVALLVLYVVCCFTVRGFATTGTQLLILKDAAIVGTIGVGMTLVIVLGSIDLSVGSLLALAGGLGMFVFSAVFEAGGNESTALVAGIATMVAAGAAGGAFNGLLVTLGRIEPFIATLGTMAIYRAVSRWIVGSGSYEPPRDSTLLSAIDVGVPLGGGQTIHISVLIWIAVIVVGGILLSRTRLGRYTIAIGSNERTARYSAIPVGRIKLLVFTFLGLCTGIAGFSHVARIASVNSVTDGMMLELDVIAAVVIGGTSLRGGSGSVVGTILGAILIAAISQVLLLRNVPSEPQELIKGVLIIAAVLAYRFSHRR